MRKTLASLATAAVATLGLVVLAPPAQAEPHSPNCVTPQEYDRIRVEKRDGRDGMRRIVVHRIFDTAGEFYGRGDGHLGRIYELCGRHRVDDVIVDYTKQGSGHRRVNFKGIQNLGWDDRDCVRGYEYRNIKDLMSRWEVKSLILDGQRGTRIDSNVEYKMQLHFEACGDAGNVAVHFEQPNKAWRVVAKERLG